MENTEEKTMGGWRRRNNVELYEIHQDVLLSSYIKRQRIKKHGHLRHMGEGRPRIRCKDSVEDDIRWAGMDSDVGAS